MKNLVRVSKIDEDNFPFKKATLYKWHSTGLHPEIFRKFSGILFVNLDDLQDAIENSNRQKEN